MRGSAGWRGCGLLLSLLAAAGCPGRNSSPGRPVETTERVYELHCLGCHGAKGEGPWGPNIQDLNLTVDQIVAVIAEGRGKMPAFGGHLSNAEMRHVAEYVKTFRSKP